MNSHAYHKLIQKAANYIKKQDVLFVLSGAGMSVDSGLPDFRGDKGLISQLQGIDKDLQYYEIINHKYFAEYPEKFWYIYGDRYMKYKAAQPHQGFHFLREICQQIKKNQYYIYTSNVDGMYQKASFPEDKIVECHGNINYLQCDHCYEVFEKKELNFELDHDKKISLTIPKCDLCKQNLRPNILLWSDMHFIFDRRNKQIDTYEKFVWDHKYNDSSIAILEIGAGTTHQAIRVIAEDLLDRFGSQYAKMIRINPQQSLYSVLGNRYVNYISEKNIDEYDKISNNDKLEIMEINETGLNSIRDIYSNILKL